MQTLEVVCHRVFKRHGVSSLCVDVETESVYATVEENDLLEINSTFDQEVSKVSTTPMGETINLSHVPMLESTYVITTTEMFVKSAVLDEPEFVGSIDCGIDIAEWSPDQELLTVINGDNELVCLSKNFDPVFEHPVCALEFGKEAPINVGWGKKETQFQGKAGKLVNQPKIIAASVPFDDRKPRLSWRGDGQFFATSTYDEDTRVIRIWTREGELSATSELIGGLESALAWRPSGNLIASTQRLPHRHDVVFFERNGLRHGDFSLPFAAREMHVVSLSWSCDSSTLCVWCVSLPEFQEDGEHVFDSQEGVLSNTKTTHLLFYRSSNYHWYLQQDITFHGEDVQNSLITSCSWHPEDPTKFYYSTNTSISQLTFRLNVVDTGAFHNNNAKHSSVLAVPDGKNLNITPFKRVTIPPPMADSVVSFDASVVFVSSASQVSSQSGVGQGDVVVVLTSAHDIFVWNRIDSKEKRSLVCKIHLPDLFDVATDHRLFRHAQLCDDVLFVVCKGVVYGRVVDVVHALQLIQSPATASAETGTHAFVYIGRSFVKRKDDAGEGGILFGEFSSETHEQTSYQHESLHPFFANLQLNLNPTDEVMQGDDQAEATEINIDEEGDDGIFEKDAVKEIQDSSSEDDASLSLILAVTPHTSKERSLVIELDNGHVFCVSVDTSNALSMQPLVDQHDESITLVEPCKTILFLRQHVSSAVPATAAFNASSPDLMVVDSIIGLSSNSLLIANNHILANDCNSFALHPEFLIFTTHMHTCRFVRLSNNLSQLNCRSTKQYEYDHTIRALERGSRITCVPRDDIKLILQMPRGNLEVIQPRSLILHRAKILLDKHNYSDVFFMLRKHRLSLNLIYDHHPSAFEENVIMFVSSINSAQHLNLFIMELKDEDTTHTMYPLLYHNNVKNCVVGQAPGKVAKVCDIVREACIAVNEDAMLLSILTTFIKVNPMRIEEALTRIQSLRTAAPKEGERATANEDRSRAALKYMLLLVDVDVLYHEALGTYNLEFALMVAQVAHMDPKLYLPFLNSLREQPPSLRHYTIDVHLKRYTKALAHLAGSNTEAYFQRSLDLIQDHVLYAEALKLYSHRPEKEVRAIASAYGDYLLEKLNYSLAGVMYERAGAFDNAITAYGRGLDWQRVFGIAKAQNLASEQMRSLAEDIADTLKTHRRFKEAGIVLDEFGENGVGAAGMYIQGRHFEDCLLMAKRRGLSDVIDRELGPAVSDTLKTLITQQEENQELLQKYAARITTVRAEKMERMRMEAMGLLDGDFEDGMNPDSDLFSEASTVASRRSGRSRRSEKSKQSTSSTSSKRSRATTARSAKGRRKHKGKVFSLKEGGVFEEEALMHAVDKVVKVVDGDKETVRSVMLMGVHFGFISEVEALELAYAACRNSVMETINIVWHPFGTFHQQQQLLKLFFHHQHTAQLEQQHQQQHQQHQHATSSESALPPGMSAIAQKLLSEQRAMHGSATVVADTGVGMNLVNTQISMLTAMMEAGNNLHQTILGDDIKVEVPPRPTFQTSNSWRVLGKVQVDEEIKRKEERGKKK
eukprot:m.30465 g.30465  ORF g.30465 m.30465 type:complete len:1546 (-) comp6230_c0_seq1:74-4711(-)